MPEVYRESRYMRERDTSPSDDEGYRRTTVRRYKVTPDRVERIEREVDVVEEERRSRYAPVRRSSRDEIVEVDRRLERMYIPERPRSAYDPSPHSATYVERQVIERERERDARDDHYTRVDRVEYRGDGPRGAVVERERVVERDERVREDDYHRGIDRDHGRVVYESTKEVERVDRDDVRSPRDWDRRSYWDDERETDVRVEKRVELRDSHGGEVRLERRVEERRDEGFSSGGADVERWRKETEYYEPAPPAPAPIVIRQRAPEQKIILQEAPPATVVIREQSADNRELALARQGSRDGEYYYHRESREVGPYRGERREEEYAMARYDDDHRHRHHHHHRHHRHHHRESYSDGGDTDDEYYVRRSGSRRERSSSSSPHRKRHIAEGALAGAGISAILASRRDSHGEYKQHRGRKVLAGAALGALGTEVARRAHSAYQERYGDDERERSRSRSRSRPPHSRLKTGLGIAAVALAAAGAAKYYQSSKIEKEEMNRGRTLHRDSDSDRSPSRKRSKSRASSVAKAGLGTAAVAGLVQHYRHKSKSRDGKSRSRSRLRTGAEILAAGLAGAGAKKLYDKHKEKKEEEKHDREREREFSDDEYYDRDARDYHRRSRSRSLSRSGPTYPDNDSSVADPELGMVEYGAQPLYADPSYQDDRGAASEGYESAAEERTRRRRRRHSGRRRSDDDYSADSESETDRDKKAEKKRSGSRLRDLAAGAAAAGAAAIGLKKLNDRKEKGKEKEKDDKDRERDRERNREKERERGRERDRRRYVEEDPADENETYGRRAPSPPHASGGYYNPPPAATQGAPAPTNGFTQHPNIATTNLNQQYAPYPPDSAYTPYAPPVPGPPPNSAVGTGAVPPPMAPPPNPTGPEHVSEASRVGRSTPEAEAAVRSDSGEKKDRVKPANLFTPPANTTSETDAPDTPRTSKSVIFVPLSPKSSATLRRHHEEQGAKSDAVDISSESDDNRISSRRGRNSDPSSGRPLTPGRRVYGKGASSEPETDDEEAIEMLPDRFDAEGRPLDGSSPIRGRGSAWHSRRGDFEYRSPRGANGMSMRGEWGVAGTDAEAVERIVRNVTGVLEGRGSWLGLISGILSGSLLSGGDGTGEERRRLSHRERERSRDRDRDRDRSRDDRDESRRRRRRDDDGGSRRRLRRREEEEDERDERDERSRGRWKADERGESSRHAEDRRARGREREVSDDDDNDDYYDDYHEERKRRRRRREDELYERGVGRSQTWA
ncbi:uncharacterized protein P884DRAFT_198993 [Thermothelomyces heterothallicus CBS 202.75]|uniref:uncharacterized protein n=1 Tax=Thermothelomyces heterothallicus CBS 202.75 TaxID=1149848 RepID=UPI003742C824